MKEAQDTLTESERFTESALYDLLDQILPHMGGWCPIEKARFLCTWILRKRPTLIVEIGVFAGRSLIPMGLSAREVSRWITPEKCKVYGIDPYTLENALEGEQPAENEKWWKEVDLPSVKAAALASIATHDLGDTVQIIDSPSSESIELFEDDSIDVLHIDGNHSEIASCRDVGLWFPKVKRNGIIVLDDTDWRTVQLARDLLNLKAQRIRHASTWEVFQKSKP